MNENVRSFQIQAQIDNLSPRQPMHLLFKFEKSLLFILLRTHVLRLSLFIISLTKSVDYFYHKKPHITFSKQSP